MGALGHLQRAFAAYVCAWLALQRRGVSRERRDAYLAARAALAETGPNLEARLVAAGLAIPDPQKTGTWTPTLCALLLLPPHAPTEQDPDS